MTTTTDFIPDAGRSRTDAEKGFDRGFIWVTRLLAWLVGVILLIIALKVGQDALPAMSEFGLGFLVDSTWNPVESAYGAFPMIAGTLISSAIALLVAVPLGLGTAIFLSEDYLPTSVRTPLTFMVELLAAIPSVVYGLWGIYILSPFMTPFMQFLHNAFGWIPLFGTIPTNRNMLLAGLVLSIMILPIITAIARDSLAALPPDLRQASLGLGASRWTTILRILVPAAFSGIVGGIMLALGRAMGETMAVTMLVGNSTQFNISLLAPGNSIASLLANQFAEASGLQVSALMYAGFVLFVMTLIVNVLAEVIVRRVQAIR